MRQKRVASCSAFTNAAKPWSVNGTRGSMGGRTARPELERLTDALAKGFTRFPTLNSAPASERSSTGLSRSRPTVIRSWARYPAFRITGPHVGLWPAFARAAAWASHLPVDGHGRARGRRVRARHRALRPARNAGLRAEKAERVLFASLQDRLPKRILASCAPGKTSAIHERLRRRRSRFGVSYGLEYPLTSRRRGRPRARRPSLGRSNAFVRVGAECAAAGRPSLCWMRHLSANIEVSGSGAEAALTGYSRTELPAARPGQRLTPMLGASGRLMGDLTTSARAESLLMFGSGYLQSWHMRWFEEQMPMTSVTVRNLSDESAGSRSFGPKSREASAAYERGCQPCGFPFMTREDDGCRALQRASRADIRHGRARLRDPRAAGIPRPDLRPIDGIGRRTLGLTIGMYALLFSQDREERIGIWSREFSRDYTPSRAVSRASSPTTSGCLSAATLPSGPRCTPARRLVLTWTWMRRRRCKLL